MRRILFVDDDPLVVRIYREALSRQGLHVDTAYDGLSASNALRAAKPDLMVLDLMMPKLTGVDVLKFVRAEPTLADLPIIVLSNSYMDDLAREAAAAGAERALLKVRCTPTVLMGVIREILDGAPPAAANVQLLATAKNQPTNPQSRSSTPSPASTAAGTQGSPSIGITAADAEFRAKARKHFVENGSANYAALRSLFQAFARAQNDAERAAHLDQFYRKVHFLAASAGLAECYPIARMASVFEAMLFELNNRPSLTSPSVLRTTALALDVFGALLQHARNSNSDAPITGQVLVVDDDPLSNRLVVTALRNAQLQAVSTENPMLALEWLRERAYDLVMLDIEMPGLDGFELCKRLRRIPGYQKVPVIYVTSHSDFENRAKIALAGGDDLIGKPVFPMELAVKAMTHLFSSKLGLKN